MVEEDWGTFFSDFAEDALLGDIPGRVMIDEPSGTVQGNMVIISARTLLWPSIQWPQAKEKDIVEVGKRRFRLTEPPQAEADGKLIRVPVKEIS